MAAALIFLSLLFLTVHWLHSAMKRWNAGTFTNATLIISLFIVTCRNSGRNCSIIRPIAIRYIPISSLRFPLLILTLINAQIKEEKDVALFSLVGLISLNQPDESFIFPCNQVDSVANGRLNTGPIHFHGTIYGFGFYSTRPMGHVYRLDWWIHWLKSSC